MANAMNELYATSISRAPSTSAALQDSNTPTLRSLGIEDEDDEEDENEGTQLSYFWQGCCL
jgi:hypothetical protein